MDNKVNMALSFAMVKHENQYRKDGTPYISHPIIVVELIEEFFADHPLINELKIAGYLHDTIEDTDTTIDEIRKYFGDYVAHLVWGLTNDRQLVEKYGKTDYLCYKLVNMDENTLNIKLCDRLANILDLTNAPLLFEEKYELQTMIIMNYVLNNRKLTPIQMKIIDEINMRINNLRKSSILKLNKE